MPPRSPDCSGTIAPCSACPTRARTPASSATRSSPLTCWSTGSGRPARCPWRRPSGGSPGTPRRCSGSPAGAGSPPGTSPTWSPSTPPPSGWSGWSGCMTCPRAPTGLSPAATGCIRSGSTANWPVTATAPRGRVASSATAGRPPALRGRPAEPPQTREDIMEIPRIISVDDHVIEPAHVWQEYLPAAFRDRGPRLTRVKGRLRFEPRHMAFREQEDGYWADCWSFGGMLFPVTGGFAAVSFPRDQAHNRAVLFEDILPGCYDRAARLADMDRNHTDASLCFPTFPRFCGQTFLERGDRDLALACVRAYNDWMIGEWCADAARGRLIPLTLIPMWDPDLAAQEVRRCAAKGSHAIAFSENPAALGLPSVHTDAWDPLWAACEETDTVVNMHIGSSSTFSKTSDDAPPLVIIALTFEGASHALVDWLTCGVLARFSSLRIALSEGQVGWMPFLLERLDEAWEHARGYAKTQEKVPEPPSTYVPGRVFGCIFDDQVGLALRDRIGMGQIMFETDYPHGDSTFPHSRDTAATIASKAGLSEQETWRLLRGNAISCYRLDRYGITH